ncbi:unnamed protein product (macronuclear) [Paramecium tetraurelia]|uniref:Rab-GAP TBC domain-containing protein n=1 Tax=Paramecium tetraurelia TaxID=5888 RepID=A0CTM8_PARTE|nr:uncharacterized protein GSPATT00010379001 [Paramecium tetraurelia]CAK74145.1 unnamed protein product [Paramecium tetraurelia]|eukprot:XP_001441542.1 hypothetical protein (macronuclear) [Paramecium tetraurelia strain d4-2]
MFVIIAVKIVFKYMQLGIQLYAKPNDFVKDFNKQQRVCDNCFRDYTHYQQIIQENGLKWNTRSLLQSKWIGNQERQIKMEISISENDKEIIGKDVLAGRTDAFLFNYSLREFITQCQQGYDQSLIRASINRVLQLFVTHYPIIGYCQGMNFIVTVLLCLSDEEGAFHIMNHIFKFIIPPRFYSNSQGATLIGFQAELYFLKSIIKGLNVQNSEQLFNFLDVSGPQMLLTLLLQVLNTSSLLITWEAMFKRKSFIPIDQATIFSLLQAAKCLDMNQQGLIEEIGKIIKHSDLAKLLSKENAYFPPFERQVQIEQYYSQTSQSWVDEDKLILFRLKKITNFDTEEILQIQKEFKKYCLESGSLCIIRKDQKDAKQQAKLTESSDGDDLEIQALFIQQIKSQKYGINKEAFLGLMEQFHQHYTKYQVLDRHKYELVFSLFDENKSELLDFREFLTCLSVLLRGSFEQKLKMFFTAHTGSSLIAQEFHTLLSIIIPQELQQNEEYQQFLYRIQLPQYSYQDMLLVSQDPFVLQNEYQREKSQTSIMIAQSFNHMKNH